MPDSERILISELPSDAIWRKLRLKFREHDVEQDSEDDNVYDLREHDNMLEDEVFFWGRDGWAGNFWHARIYLERHKTQGTLLVYAERGDNKDCMQLLPFRRMLLSFMSDCMSAREHTP
jgi:hypothetical protein